MDGANAASAASGNSGSSLPLRLASVIILIPLIVGGVYLSLWGVVALVLLSTVIGIRELYAIFRIGGYQPLTWVGTAIALGFGLAATFEGQVRFDLSGVIVGASVVLSLIAVIARPNREGALVDWALTLAGAYYIGGLLSYYIVLRRLETPLEGGLLEVLQIAPGAAWIFTVLAITWLQDTAAYFVGRTLGRHRMAPILSPKKSWEGAIGGFVVSLLTALLADLLLGLPLLWWQCLLLGVATGIAGPLGDLAESLIKRQIGIKDSGQLIPGHGGILDRADSLLFNAITTYLIVVIFL